jgi:hypothetical protein
VAGPGCGQQLRAGLQTWGGLMAGLNSADGRRNPGGCMTGAHIAEQMAMCGATRVADACEPAIVTNVQIDRLNLWQTPSKSVPGTPRRHGLECSIHIGLEHTCSGCTGHPARGAVGVPTWASRIRPDTPAHVLGHCQIAHTTAAATPQAGSRALAQCCHCQSCSHACRITTLPPRSAARACPARGSARR